MTMLRWALLVGLFGLAACATTPGGADERVGYLNGGRPMVLFPDIQSLRTNDRTDCIQVLRAIPEQSKVWLVTGNFENGPPDLGVVRVRVRGLYRSNMNGVLGVQLGNDIAQPGLCEGRYITNAILIPEQAQE